MILDTFIPELAFSSALSDIVLVKVTEDVAFELSYATTDADYQVILSELYTPDNDGMIHILDLQKITNGYLSENPVLNFKFKFESESDSVEFHSRIILSRAELDTDARKFVSQRFLSLMQGDKTIRSESLEYLSFYALEPENITINTSYRNNESGEYETDSVNTQNTDINRIITLNVNPSKYKKDGKTLVKYSVKCGNRVANYFIDNLSAESPAEILFTNNFGVPETFSTSGNLARERKSENEYATIKGEYVKAYNSFQIEYIANTGIMDQHTANWIGTDLFSSYNVFIVKDMQIWKEITITDDTVKRTSDSTELPSYEFKYRLKQRNQRVIQFNKYLYRLFDLTFDNKFN